MYDRNTLLRAAMLWSSRRYCCSEMPSGRSNGSFKRIREGMASSMSASIEGAPTRRSICSASVRSGPMCRAANVSRSNTSRHQSRVLTGVQERGSLARIGELQENHPARVRILVDGLRLVLEGGVDLEHLARHRGVELRHRLDRLDRAERLARLQLGADFRQLDIDHVPELLLRVIGDPDLSSVPGEIDPLVLLRKLE